MKKKNYMHLSTPKIILILFFISLIVFVQFAYGSSNGKPDPITVTKTSTRTADINQIITITITIKNNLNERVEGTVMEPTLNGAKLVSNLKLQPLPEYTQMEFAILPPCYYWDITLQPKSTKKIIYKIKAIRAGTLILEKTKVRIKYDGDKYFVAYSKNNYITVRCNDNDKCEYNLGENEVTCPHDCPPSPPYANICSDTCGVDIFGRCNSMCYNVSIPSCALIDRALLSAFKEHCKLSKNNEDPFTYIDQNNHKLTLTCCSYIIPYVKSLPINSITVANSKKIVSIKKSVTYKNSPFEIRIIVVS
ncbi:MAG: hypothetical protein GWP09_00610 [Nitrospiraceae bacterium]|nr:hypothetical protein [Nitrospiraceae bacterium]